MLGITAFIVFAIGAWKIATKLYAIRRGQASGDGSNRRDLTVPCATPGVSETDCILDQGKPQQKDFIIGSGGFYF